MPQSTRMHLAIDLSLAHANGTWRYPGAWDGYPPFGDPAYFEEIGRIAERGCFDLAFFADTAGTQGDGVEIADAVHWGNSWPRHDPTPMAVAMACATTRLGLGITMSTTYQHPFHVARLFNALDHVTRGRIAWNAVTSAYKNEAANFGYDVMPDHEWRYRRADEHLRVCLALWDSVGPNALVLDTESGQYADPDLVRRIDHVGEFFRVAGPLPVVPSPQGRPPIIQAGASDTGLAFAARYADYQFADAGSIDGMRDHRARLDAAIATAGRDPRDVGILWAIRVDVVDSAEEAAEHERLFAATQSPDAGIRRLSQMFSVDLAAVPPETPLGELEDSIRAENTNWGYLHDAIRTAGPDTAIIDYANWWLLHGSTEAVGTPEQVADRLQEMHEASGSNGGIMITRFMSPHAQLTRFVEEVVPILRDRGLVSDSYKSHLLRDNLLD